MIKKEVFKGFLVGLIANSVGFSILILLFSSLTPTPISFEETIIVSFKNGSLGRIIGLGAILNLIAFFLFLKKNKPYYARGVLLATIVATLYIAFNKLS